MYGALTCLGRHTVTGMLTASGKQFVDWSGAYRLFSKQRVDVSKTLNVVQSNVLQETSCLPHIVAHVDDTVIKKNGGAHPGHRMEEGCARAALPNQFHLGATLHPNFARPPERW